MSRFRPESGEEPPQDAQPHPELQPDLPKWFREHEAGHYQEVLQEELGRIVADPDAYFAHEKFYPEGSGAKPLDMSWEEYEEQKISWEDYKKEQGLSSEEIRQLSLETQSLLGRELSFDTVGPRIAGLMKEIGGSSESIEQDAQEYIKELVVRVHAIVLRRMVKEYLPRRKAIVHRGNFQEYSEQARMILPEAVLKKITSLGPRRNILKLILKDNSFHIEKTKEHLEEGIGGFEFDVKTRGLADNEPVVTHAHIPAGRKKAPSLDEVLGMVRELLPDDPKEERSARRGLKLIMHLKVMEYRSEALQRILEIVDKYNLGNRIYIQTGRPELVYRLDDLENERNRKNPKRKTLRYLFQAVQVPESSTLAKRVTRKIHKGGEPEGELRSWLNAPDNITPLEEWPPRGRLLDILKKHQSLLWVPVARYNKDLLQKAQDVGLGVSIGAFDRADQMEEMLEADEEGRSPHSIVSLKKNMVYPKEQEEQED